MDLSSFGKLLLGLGGLLLLIGALLVFGGRLPGIGALGRLPGDIVIKRDNFSFYFPLTTSLLISIILSLMLWLIFRR
jgi:formate hydrogenlyase subunit 3/multisubunit Na+/H+ antiporter MnhD subunit